MKEIERPDHYRKLIPTVKLNPGWYRSRMGRYIKIFCGNFPHVLGYKDLSGAVWSVKDACFYRFGTWDSRGNSIDLGSQFDIVEESKIPKNFPDRETELERLGSYNVRSSLQSKILEHFR